MRDVSNCWIDSIRITPVCLIPRGSEQQEPHASSALSQLSRFPRTAVLHELVWSCSYGGNGPLSDDGYELWATYQAIDLLTSFLWEGRDHLSCLRSFTFNGKNFGFGDAAALADTCPQLQYLEIYETNITGPAFAPLQRLRSLTSLALHRLWIPDHHVNAVMSSLSSITTLTKLSVASDRDGWTEMATEVNLPVLLPWLASLAELRDLQIDVEVCGPEAVGTSLVQHISGLQHLTTLKVWDCTLPTCLHLDSAPNRVEVDLPWQTLGTPLIRSFAAMPRLKRLTVMRLQLDCDLSHLQCSWEQLVVKDEMSLQHLVEHLVTLQQLLWLPRNMATGLSVRSRAEWRLEKGVSLDSACRVLREAEQLMAEKPEFWKGLKLEACLLASPAADTAAPPCTAVAQQSAWSALFRELSRLQQYLEAVSVRQGCQLDAGAVTQGARWLPRLHKLQLDPQAPGFDKFVEALGETAWVQLLDLDPSVYILKADGLPEGSMAALRQLAVKRACAGHSLGVQHHGWLTPAQVDALNQAAGQHCQPGCSVVFRLYYIK